MLKAHIKLEQYGYAIVDATRAIDLDSSYAKVVLPNLMGEGRD